MGKRYAPTVTRITLSIKTSVGSVEPISLTTAMRCRCGGAAARKARSHPVVSFLSMSARTMRTQMTSKKRRSRCKGS